MVSEFHVDTAELRRAAGLVETAVLAAKGWSAPEMPSGESAGHLEIAAVLTELTHRLQSTVRETARGDAELADSLDTSARTYDLSDHRSGRGFDEYGSKGIGR